MSESTANINIETNKDVSERVRQVNERLSAMAKYIADRFDKLSPSSLYYIPPMSEQIGEIAEALSKAQGEYPKLTCNRGGHHSRYADIEIMLAATRKALKENGLAILQIDTPVNKDTYILNTTLTHKSGQFFNSSIMVDVPTVLKQGKTDLLQQFGSDMSYHKRYALQAILGIAPVQDGSDDNAGFKE